jgi:rubrerythrin
VKNLIFCANNANTMSIKEFTTIFIDLHYLHKNHIKTDQLTDILTGFTEKKKKIKEDTILSLFYYDEDSNPIFDEKIKTSQAFKEIITNQWTTRKDAESYFENGMFYCLSYLSKQALNHKGIFRVIVISDIPSRQDQQYTEALMNLVEMVRHYPTSIDIIRVGEAKNYEDEVKLRVITDISKGKIFYVNSEKQLAAALDELVKSKDLSDLLKKSEKEIADDKAAAKEAREKDENYDPDFDDFDDDEDDEIDDKVVFSAEKKKYYESQAKDLLPHPVKSDTLCLLCKRNICHYCSGDEDHALECPSCGTVFHECCAAKYTYGVNIGMSHIFRCAKCESMVKMDEKVVKELNENPGFRLW